MMMGLSEWRFVIVPIVLSLPVAGCLSLGGQHSEPAVRRDAVLTTDVKGALIGSPQVSAASIRVTLEGRTLVLSGLVDDERERAEAASIARRVAAGRPVDNRLDVR